MIIPHFNIIKHGRAVKPEFRIKASQIIRYSLSFKNPLRYPENTCKINKVSVAQATPPGIYKTGIRHIK